MVSSKGMLVKREWTFKDTINKPVFCSQIVSENSKESFKANSLEIRCLKDITNPYNCLLKNTNFPVKTSSE